MAIYDYLRTSSLDVEGTLNFRRHKERRKYNSWILGTALRSELGHERITGESIYSTPPSWTQTKAGLSHAYVLRELSSSQHAVTAKNSFHSGSTPLETSAVPASGTMFYEKNSRFVHRVYKLSASIALSMSGDRTAFSEEIPSGQSRTAYVANSGVLVSRNYFNPAVFEIDVPDYGRIRDVKVWVEFIHDVRSGTGSIGGADAYLTGGLQNVQVSLRSPNVSFRAAHPLWNTRENARFRHRPNNPNLTGTANQFGDGRFYEPPELLKNSYLLWAGYRLDMDDLLVGVRTAGDLTGQVAISQITDRHMNWDMDLDMRTVFSDSSKVPNTCHVEDQFTGPITETSAGTSQGVTFLTGTEGNPADVLKHSPTYVLSTAIEDAVSQGILASADHVAYFFDEDTAEDRNPKGSNTPWFIDRRVKPGNIPSATLNAIDVYYSKTWGLSGAPITSSSPPPGWLTGPAKTAAENEFPTTGSNIGPSTMRPVYPILDDVFEKHVTKAARGGFDNDYDRTRVNSIGFRPGLRGTEVHGKWKLMIGVGSVFDDPAGVGYRAHERAAVWFRQFRLEFILDQKQPAQAGTPSKLRRFERTAHVPNRPGRSRIHTVRGSTNWEYGINFVYTVTPEEYGRAIGITSNTGSHISDFAVFSRITGSLLSAVTGTAQTNMLSDFLRNEFGTPYIPLSSGSGENPTFLSFGDDESLASRALSNDILRPRTMIKSAQTLRSTLNRTKFTRSVRDQVISRISSLNELGNTSGSIVPV